MAMPGYPAGDVTTVGYDAPRQWWPGYALVGGCLVVGAVLGAVVGGPLGQFMLAGIEVVPFALLALLAYLGVRWDWARVLAYIWLAIILLGIGGVALALSLAALLAQSGALAQPGATSPGALLPPGGGGQLGGVALASLLGRIMAGVLLLPGVRRAISRVIPIDPRSSVHAIALAVVGGSIVIALGQLIATGSRPAVLETVEMIPEQSAADQLLGIVYPFVWTVPGALLAAGFPVVRTLPGVLQRLGLIRPTGRQVAAGIVIALALVVGATWLDAGIGRLWETLGWPQTDAEAFDRLLGAAISPIGAVLIGATAGIGEELVVRGALQPRLGIVLSNLFFASLHAFQYGFDALLSVFVIGLVLGIVRARSNTTTSAIIHGVYDFVLVMLSALGWFE